MWGLDSHGLKTLNDEEVEALYKERKAKQKEQDTIKRDAYYAMKFDLVFTSVDMASYLQQTMKSFHEKTMNDLLAFRELMNEYGDLPKKSKGGFSIDNEDLTKRVRLKFKTLGDFDERANLAESHIRNFFERTLKEVDPKTFEILMKLLERKKGKLEYSRVMQILSFEEVYEDSDWRTGCRLLKESFQETGTKYYIEFEEKDDNGNWKIVNLNFSSY